jgi:hypothetical protein
LRTDKSTFRAKQVPTYESGNKVVALQNFPRPINIGLLEHLIGYSTLTFGPQAVGLDLSALILGKHAVNCGDAAEIYHNETASLFRPKLIHGHAAKNIPRH